MPHEFDSLLVVLAAAVLAVLVADYVKALRLPAILLEIALGIVIGPQVLRLADVDATVDLLSTLGLAFLIFMAGYEADFSRIRGRTLDLAIAGWFVSLGIAFAVALPLQEHGVVVSDLLVGLALSTTALGTLLPILRDARLLGGPLGTCVMGVGTVGEFGPIVAITLLLSGDAPLRSTVLLLVFVAVAVLTAVLSLRMHTPRVITLLQTTMHSSAQLAVRVSVLLLVLLLAVAADLGLDVLLGAFAAGIIARLLGPRSDAGAVSAKLDAIGFGFLIPVFFVTTGMQFDLDSLLASPTAVLKLLLFLALLLVIRGLPALLYRRDLPTRGVASLAFFSAAGLPLIVAITHIGLQTGRMHSDTAAALVGAGMASVFLYPLIGTALARRTPGGGSTMDASDGGEGATLEDDGTRSDAASRG